MNGLEGGREGGEIFAESAGWEVRVAVVMDWQTKRLVGT